jgi:putative ABC transport system permease protein
MSWLTRLFCRRDLYTDLAEEMREHIEEKTEQVIREGMSREEAEGAARRAFRNTTLIEEQGREAWQWPTLESIWSDVKYGLRQLYKSPGFTVTAVLALALGVGAHTAVFSVLNAVLFRPLPFPDSDRLVTVLSTGSFREHLQALPGVKTASITMIYPPDDRWTMQFSIVGRPVSRMEDIPSSRFGVVDPYYLTITGIPLLAGRDFSESDNERSPVVAIVNQVFVRRYLPDADPIGRHIEMGTPANLNAPDPWLGNQHIPVTIIGVMRDTKTDGLALPAQPQFITLFRQTPAVNFGFKEVMVRSDIAPGALIDQIREQLHQLDPLLPLSEAATMTEFIEEQTSDKRFTTALLSALAALGLVLAIVGVYGVVSYLVVQRQQEIGIRLALGSPRTTVLGLITRQGLILAITGAALGLIGTAVASRSVASFLYGISALDLFTLCGTSAVLIVIALLASAIPGRRAMRINPIQALRAE